MDIKVMSFNVQHFENFNTEKIDFDAYAEYLKTVDADIIGLNEIRGEGENPDYTAQSEIMAEKLGMYYFFAPAIVFDGKNPYGNAILSKYPILESEIIPIPDPVERRCNGYYETRCLLRVKIDMGDGLSVFVTHFGLNEDEHENAVQTICANIDDKCILMGDFNVCPDNPILEPIRYVLSDTAIDNDKMLSFPSDSPDRKIDYMFVGKGIKTVSAEILPVVLSDHRPYFSILSI